MNTPAHIVALSKAINEKAEQYKTARGALPIGSHKVDFTVRIAGLLLVGADTDKTPTVSIPMKETLALFIRYSGITRERAISLLQLAMAEALAAAEDGTQNTHGTGAIREALPVIDDTIKSVVEPILAKMPRTPVKGAVRSELTVVEIDTPELAVAVAETRPRRRKRTASE